MSTATLTVQKAHTVVRCEDAGRGARLAAAFDRALAAPSTTDALTKGVAAPGPGLWCVPRLDVVVLVDGEDEDDMTLGAAWSGAVLASVRAALARPDVVRFDDAADALADLVASLAGGHAERWWAWCRAGVVPPGTPAPGGGGAVVVGGAGPGSAADAVVTCVATAGPQAVAAFVEGVTRAGLAAVDRLLGPRGWSGLAAAHAPGVVAVVEESDPVDAGLLRRSRLAALVAHARRRPDAVTRRAWAVLVALEIDPSVATRPDVSTLVARVHRALASTPRPAPWPVLSSGSTEVSPASPTPAGATALPATPAAGTPGSVPTGPPVPDDVVGTNGPDDVPPRLLVEAPESATYPTDPTNPTGESTVWAGLMFLLATASEAGISDAVDEDPALSARSAAWVRHRLGQLLVPAGPDDPVLRALAGLDPGRATAVLAGPEPDKPERAALAGFAGTWARATARRLGDAVPEGRDPVHWMAQRPGRVVAVPGWIEVHLPLDVVDPGIRAAGLDIDPGWTPWLGAVVRYVYE